MGWGKIPISVIFENCFLCLIFNSQNQKVLNRIVPLPISPRTMLHLNKLYECCLINRHNIEFSRKSSLLILFNCLTGERVKPGNYHNYKLFFLLELTCSLKIWMSLEKWLFAWMSSLEKVLTASNVKSICKGLRPRFLQPTHSYPKQ